MAITIAFLASWAGISLPKIQKISWKIFQWYSLAMSVLKHENMSDSFLCPLMKWSQNFAFKSLALGIYDAKHCASFRALKTKKPWWPQTWQPFFMYRFFIVSSRRAGGDFRDRALPDRKMWGKKPMSEFQFESVWSVLISRTWWKKNYKAGYTA